ncbi:MAG TPA: IS66 family transposase [Nitrospirota bacterium]|nr:IS66 family transposase [Nitrospirota bacterium]
MGRHPVAPYGFVCIYEHTCPYLDGLSTSWVYGEYRRSEAAYHEHLQLIDAFRETVDEQNEKIRALERELAEVRAKYQALHRKQFKPNKRTDGVIVAGQESGSGKAGRKPKKRGAPAGHPPWTRQVPSRIDLTVPVPAPTTCPHCGSGGLTPEGTLHEHIQEDIVLAPRTVVTKFVHEEAFCTGCRRSVVALGPNEIPNALIGPVAKSTAGWLRYRIGISYRKVQRILDELFGLSCVPASLVGFDTRAAGRGEPLYDDVREKIRAAEVLYGDETTWRNDGQGHFVWFAGNDRLAFFRIDRHRSAEAARAVYGEQFSGSLVRDRYGAYNDIGSDWQACLAHIITNAKAIRTEHALLPIREQDRHVTIFCDQVADFCSRACAVGQELKEGTLPWTDTAPIEKRLTNELNRICKRPLPFKPAENLRAFLNGPEQKRLFTFLRVPGMSPTNNHAEQSLRHMVIFRKISFGTRSEAGIKTHSILPTLIQTARRQGVHPREFLQTLHTADTATAQAALYNNSG